MHDDHGFIALAAEWGIWALSGLAGAILLLIRWVYVRDNDKIERALSGIRSDHGRLIDMVNEINATRPLRQELTEAVDDLRKEVAVEFASLRTEIRTDINGLRTDVTSRLDTLIRMQGGK